MKRKKGSIYEDFVRKEVRDHWIILLIAGFFFIFLSFGLSIIVSSSSKLFSYVLVYLMLILLVYHTLISILSRLKLGEAISHLLHGASTSAIMSISFFMWSFVGVGYGLNILVILQFILIFPIMILAGFVFFHLKWKKSYLPRWIENKAWDPEKGIFDPIAAQMGQLMGPKIIVGGILGGLMGLIGIKIAQTMSTSFNVTLILIISIFLSSFYMFSSTLDLCFTRLLHSWEKQHNRKIYLKGFEPKER
jgi:hypothetical protein